MTMRLEIAHQLVFTFCPECGLGAAVDDDGCCKTCGATATGTAVQDWIESRNRAVDQVKKTRADLRVANRAWKAALKRIAELESRLKCAERERRQCTCCED